MTVELDTIVVDLVNMQLTAGAEVHVYTGGMLRGRLDEFRFMPAAIPSSTYLSTSARDYSLDLSKIPCVLFAYTPRQKNPDAKLNFTRKQQMFYMPAEIVNRAVVLHHVREKELMLVIDTSIKPEQDYAQRP